MSDPERPAVQGLSQLENETLALLDIDRLTAPTRAALKTRLERTFSPGGPLSSDQRHTLEAVCLRLIPEPELVRRISLAAAFEARLAEGSGRGWRYAASPADVVLHTAGLDALDVASRAQADRPFADLDPQAQDTLLNAACGGEPTGEAAPPEYWFEELLTALTEIYYAHPLVQVSIGYDGMADAYGVTAIGLLAVAAEAERLGR